MLYSIGHILLLSIDGRWCQFDANRNPQFGVRRRRKLYSGQTAQLGHSTVVRTARLWISSVVLQLIYEAARLGMAWCEAVLG